VPKKQTPEEIMMTTHSATLRGMPRRRPPDAQVKGDDVILSVRLPKYIIDALDAESEKEMRNRTNMFQVLLVEALRQRKALPQK
jgi:hypothetical protein